jgi:hypothetical protein
MPSFDSNDPREFGWSLSFRDFVPFVYKGRLFPQGMHPAYIPVLTHVIGLLEATGWQLPPASLGLECGCWGQEDRMTKSGGSISFHQFGLAADLAAPWNPWQVSNPGPSPYRLPDNTSSIVEPYGLLWGGSPRWGANRDRMHIQCNSSPTELQRLNLSGIPAPTPPHPLPGVHPFPLPAWYYFGPLSGPRESISGVPSSDWCWRPALKLAQARLHVVVDGMYGPNTQAACRRWQATHGLVVDGLIGPNTWRSLMS